MMHVSLDHNYCPVAAAVVVAVVAVGIVKNQMVDYSIQLLMFHEVFVQVFLIHVEYFVVIFEMNHYDVIVHILVGVAVVEHVVLLLD